MTEIRILIVEDEWISAATMANMLRVAGYDVLRPVNSVETAIDAIARQDPTFALVDVALGLKKASRS